MPSGTNNLTLSLFRVFETTTFGAAPKFKGFEQELLHNPPYYDDMIQEAISGVTALLGQCVRGDCPSNKE